MSMIGERFLIFRPRRSQSLPPVNLTHHGVLMADTTETNDLDTNTNRRVFLARASAITLAIPGLGLALTGCSTESSGARDSTQVRAPSSSGNTPPPPLNSNSKLDTAVLKGAPPSNVSTAVGTSQSTSTALFQRYDPTLPPLNPSGSVQLHWRSRHVPVRINASTVVAAWTFEGTLPGPIVHCRVGDTVEFTLTNESVMPHSMDFHASQVNPKTAFRSVVKGESVTFTFKPRWAGAFMYHCGTAPVLMHIGSGMYGALIVSPREPLPPAKEFVLVQSEFYLADAVNGVRAFDYAKMLTTMPDFVVFNGRPDQYDPVHQSQ